jgi:hypothetical protein
VKKYQIIFAAPYWHLLVDGEFTESFESGMELAMYLADNKLGDKIENLANLRQDLQDIALGKTPIKKNLRIKTVLKALPKNTIEKIYDEITYEIRNRKNLPDNEKKELQAFIQYIEKGLYLSR